MADNYICKFKKSDNQLVVNSRVSHPNFEQLFRKFVKENATSCAFISTFYYANNLSLCYHHQMVNGLLLILPFSSLAIHTHTQTLTAQAAMQSVELVIRRDTALPIQRKPPFLYSICHL